MYMYKPFTYTKIVNYNQILSQNLKKKIVFQSINSLFS